ncbi:MAG: hypothetical protein GY938_18460 [Ketobacter sp.]|nr:hypothetical protein [Ketobacter sp.]
MTLPELEKYNVGLGAATSRTDKQKLRAQHYSAGKILVFFTFLATKMFNGPFLQEKLFYGPFLQEKCSMALFFLKKWAIEHFFCKKWAIEH